MHRRCFSLQNAVKHKARGHWAGRVADMSHALCKHGDLVWCRRCGCWSQSRVLRLAGPCRPERLLQYGTYRRRLASLKAGRHPVRHCRLAPLEAAWNGQLDMEGQVQIAGDDDEDDEDGVQGPQVAAAAAPRSTPLGRPFLSRSRAPESVALDEWLREFARLVPDIAKRPKGKGPGPEFEEEPEDLA